MNHEDCADQLGKDVQHSHWITVVQWPTELLKSIQVLEVVFGFVGCICNLCIQLPPFLVNIYHFTPLLIELLLPSGPLTSLPPALLLLHDRAVTLSVPPGR